MDSAKCSFSSVVGAEVSQMERMELMEKGQRKGEPSEL
jgi:hypothetical protein